MATLSSITRTFTLIALLGSTPLVAQTECDSIEVIALNYGAFGDTVVNVTINNASTTFGMGYPQFQLIDALGDTLAREPMTFFSLSPGVSTHRMDLVPGAALPAATFSGTLVLIYFTADGEQACDFPITNAELCPTSCAPVNVYITADPGPPIASVFPWHLADDEGGTVATGELSMGVFGWQQDIDSLCLQPGNYTLHLEQPEAIGTNFQFGLSEDDLFFDGPHATLAAGGSGHIMFDLFEPCMSGTQSITEAAQATVQLAFDGQRATITERSGKPLGEVVVFDAMGRTLVTFNAPGASASIDLSGYAKGAYTVVVRGGHTSVLRVVAE